MLMRTRARICYRNVDVALGLNARLLTESIEVHRVEFYTFLYLLLSRLGQQLTHPKRMIRNGYSFKNRASLF